MFSRPLTWRWVGLGAAFVLAVALAIPGFTVPGVRPGAVR